MDDFQQAGQVHRGVQFAGHVCDGGQLLHAAAQAFVGLVEQGRAFHGRGQQSGRGGEHLQVVDVEEVGHAASEHQLTHAAIARQERDEDDGFHAHRTDDGGINRGDALVHAQASGKEGALRPGDGGEAQMPLVRIQASQCARGLGRHAPGGFGMQAQFVGFLIQ